MPLGDRDSIAARRCGLSSHDAEVAKGGTAPGAVGGFAFHKIDDVEAVLKPLFHKHGVMAIPTLREPMEFSPNGSWNIATAHVEVTFVNVDNPDDVVTVSFPGQGFDKQDKAAGKAISYACKNAYLSVFHLKGQPDVEADLAMKQQALDRLEAPQADRRRFRAHDRLLAFLDGL